MTMADTLTGGAGEHNVKEHHDSIAEGEGPERPRYSRLASWERRRS